MTLERHGNKLRYLIILLVILVAFSATKTSAQYITKESREQTISVNHPDLTGMTPRVRHRQNVVSGASSEWVLWGSYKRTGPHLVINHKVAGGRFEYLRVEGWFSSRRVAKKIEYKFTGKRFEVEHKLGDFQVRRYHYRYHDISKKCFAFKVMYDAASETVSGYFCKAPGETVSRQEIKNLIGSISIHKNP